jgi:hypothetical protein
LRESFRGAGGMGGLRDSFRGGGPVVANHLRESGHLKPPMVGGSSNANFNNHQNLHHNVNANPPRGGADVVSSHPSHGGASSHGGGAVGDAYTSQNSSQLSTHNHGSSPSSTGSTGKKSNNNSNNNSCNISITVTNPSGSVINEPQRTVSEPQPAQTMTNPSKFLGLLRESQMLKEGVGGFSAGGGFGGTKTTENDERLAESSVAVSSGDPRASAVFRAGMGPFFAGRLKE